MPTEKENVKTMICVTRKTVTTEAMWFDVPEGDDPKIFGDKLVRTLEQDPFRLVEWEECDVEEPHSYETRVVHGRK